jgi:hypothetical protein
LKYPLNLDLYAEAYMKILRSREYVGLDLDPIDSTRLRENKQRHGSYVAERENDDPWWDSNQTPSVRRIMYVFRIFYPSQRFTA